MKANDTIRLVAQSARGGTTLLLILLVIVVAQFCIVELAWVLWWVEPPAPPATSTQTQPTPEEAKIQRIQQAEKQFLPDGTLHLMTKIGGPRWRPQYTPDPPTTQAQVYDVNDRLLWDGPSRENPHTYLSWAGEARHPDSFGIHNMRSVQMLINARTLQVPVATEGRLLEMWRYCPWADCFVGHDLKGQRVGYLGATGPTMTSKEVEPFGAFRDFLAWWPPDSYSPILLWQTDRRIYQIDFDKQKVELVFESPHSKIAWMVTHQWDSYRPSLAQGDRGDAENPRPLLHCQTEDSKHYLVLRDPERTIAVSMPDEWATWSGNHFVFGAMDQGVFMLRNWIEYPAPTQRPNSDWWAKYRATAKTQWVELYRVSDAGQLDLVNRYSWTGPTRVRSIDPRTRIRPNVNALSPLLCDLVWSSGVRRYTSDYREIGVLIEEMRPGYRLRHWVVTAILLTLTLLHIRSRKATKATIVLWLVLVGLFNLAGFLTYWAMHHTPTIKCAACGKRRGLATSDCVRCGTALPAPEHGRLDLIVGL